MSVERDNVQTADSASISRTLNNYIRYWPLLLALLIVAAAGGWAFLQWATPEYEIKASILIKDEKKGTEDAKAVESIDQLSSKKIIENEIEVIQSNKLIDEVVKKLNLNAVVLVRDNYKWQSAYRRSPVLVSIPLVQKTTGSDDPIPFTYNKFNGQVQVQGMYYPLNKLIPTPYGRLSFITNPLFDPASTDTSFILQISDPEQTAASIHKKLDVIPASKLSSVVNLAYRDNVPVRGQQILNELMSAYNRQIVNDKNVLAANTLQLLNDRLAVLGHELDSIERNSQVYRTKKGAIDVGTQGQMFLDNVNQNDIKLSDINTQIAMLGQVDNYVQSSSQHAAIVPSALGVNDPILSELVGDLYKAQLEYEGIKKTTGENNPALLSLTDRINKIRPEIQEHIYSQKKSLETARSNLQSTNQSYAAVLNAIPEQQRQLVNISRQLSIKNDVYNNLLNKKEETALSFASLSPNTIVDMARASSEPVFPKPKIVYLTAALMAILLSMAFVMIKDMFGNKVRFKKDIEFLTSYPIIAEIGSDTTKSMIVIGDNNRSSIAEQFRKLRTTLKHAGISATQKKILITSSIPGEGKSYVATNLSLSLALTGKKVVLVDMDLNNPSLTSKIKTGSKKGISEFLEHKAEWEEIVKRTTLHDNLFFIPTGQLPDNPSELLLNGRIEFLLEMLEETFDYIILDTAPVTPVTDAYLLSPMCDLTLFVIRHRYTPKYYVQKMKEAQHMNQLKNVAIIYNGIVSSRYDNMYGDRYSYGYYQRARQDKKRIAG